MARVSVIIPTYNCSQYIAEAIDSVLNQSFLDFELIIVNDGSTDDTEEIISRYLNNPSDKIRYINQENRGLAAARNTGIRRSSGEFIAFLDADDLWLPNKLSAQISVFDQYANVGFVHTNCYGFGGPYGTYVNRFWMNAEQIKNHSGLIFWNLFFRKIRITASTVMLRRKCLDRIGHFDEALSKLGSEDRDLFLRILWEYEAVYINEPLAKYRDRSDSMGQNYGKMIKAQRYVYDKITKLYELPNSYKRKALSAVYHEWASESYNLFKFRRGFSLQLKAIFYNPGNRMAYLITKKMMKQLWNYFKDRFSFSNGKEIEKQKWPFST